MDVWNGWVDGFVGLGVEVFCGLVDHLVDDD